MGVLVCAGAARTAAAADGPAAAAVATPQPSPAKAAADGTIARFRVRDGSTIDLGWTGMAHRQAWPAEQRIEFAVDCGQDGSCAAHGGEAGTIFGAPTPLSAGGVPACVVSRLRAPISGTVGGKTGCGELRLALASTVYTASDVARPCPLCSGDVAVNDGRKQGRCDGGASAGQPCDVNSASTLLGKTSNDCLPAADAAAGTIAIDLAPLTTGTTRLTADRGCKGRGIAGNRCFCADQARPNECDSGTCDPGETCDGPVDGACSRAPYRGCRLGTGKAECDALVRGTGTCEIRMRPCFGDTIEATGACDATAPTYVAIFCAPATQASAINSSSGLPGPARLRLRLERVGDAHPAARPRTTTPPRR